MDQNTYKNGFAFGGYQLKYALLQMLLVSDGITIGEKWTTVLPSKIDVDFFYSASKRPVTDISESLLSNPTDLPH